MRVSTQLTTSEAFTESVIHDRHVILGREMQPFCLDHWELLNAFKSPLIRGGPILTVDLQRAVIACSTGSSQEFYNVILRPNFIQKCGLYCTRGLPVDPLLKAFNDYVDDYAPKFPYWRYTDDDSSKCPPLYVTAAKLIGAGHNSNQVRRMGLGEMTAWALAIYESEGNPLKSLKNNIEVEIQREIEAEEAASGKGVA